MRLNLSVLIVFLFLFGGLQTAKAQYKWDFGVTIGPSNYLGDIGGKSKDARNFVYDMQVKKTRYDLGGYARYKFHPDFSARASFQNVRITGDDALSTTPGRSGRNLSFRNDLLELAVVGEYYFYQMNDMSKSKTSAWQGSKSNKRIDFKSYVFAGVAGFRHNPKAKYNGNWVALRPLQTEGVAYGKYSVSIPMGVGVVYTYDRKWKFGFEINYRQTFTDYLDDISTTYKDPASFSDPTAAALSNRRSESTNPNAAAPVFYEPGQKRGDPKNDDVYLSANFTIGYTLKGKNSFYKSKYGHVTKGKRKFKKRRGRAKF